jgi:hypothetical protein
MYELPRTIPDVKMLLATEELMENGQYRWFVLSRRAATEAQRISKASRLTVRSFAVL